MLKLAGVQNPEVLLARERIVEAVAEHQLAAAQLLPSLNAGFDVDTHTGPLQRSVGVIQKVNRGSMYLGLGADAVGAGTVNIPGLVWSGNVSETIYARLITRQVVRERRVRRHGRRQRYLAPARLTATSRCCRRTPTTPSPCNRATNRARSPVSRPASLPPARAGRRTPTGPRPTCKNARPNSSRRKTSS